MTKPKLSELEKLMANLVVPFYLVERDAALPIKHRRYENDAEHSWSLALLACSLAPEIDTTLDVGKVAQFAIVHDLVELYAKDTSPWGSDKALTTKGEREEESLKLITQRFSLFPWIHQTIEEYEHRLSNEAKYVWAVDKVIILILRHLDKGKFFVDNGVTKQHFDERLTANRKKAHSHPVIGEYYEQLLELFEAHPEYFYRDK